MILLPKKERLFLRILPLSKTQEKKYYDRPILTLTTEVAICINMFSIGDRQTSGDETLAACKLRAFLFSANQIDTRLLCMYDDTIRVVESFRLRFVVSPSLIGVVPMIPTIAVRSKAAILLAADSATLAPAADANQMVCLQEPFTPSENLVMADLTPADFDGSTPIAVGVGTQPTAFDPNNNDMLIDLKPPVTGFRWETTGVTNLPQTIYGFALTNLAGDTLLGTERLAVPITLTAINQRVDAGAPFIRQLANSMT